MSGHPRVVDAGVPDPALRTGIERERRRIPRAGRTPPGTVDAMLVARFAARLRTGSPRQPGRTVEMPKYEYRWVHDGDVVWTGLGRPVDMTPAEDEEDGVLVCERRLVGPWIPATPDDEDESGTMD